MMTEEQKEELALSMTQKMYEIEKKHAYNEYPLGIDDKLHRLMIPGMYFIEKSWIDTEDGLIVHAISVKTFRQFEVRVKETIEDYTRGFCVDMVDAMISNLMDQIT